MTMPAAAQPGWTVTGQQESTEVTQDSRVVSGVRVYFTTASGVQASVFVPQLQYSADFVRTAIAQKVATIEEINGLGGGAPAIGQ